MRVRLGLLGPAVSLLLTIAAESTVLPDGPGEAAAEPIVTRMVDRAIKQQSELLEYSAMRRYTIRNSHLSSDASMTAQVVYQAGKGKHFAVLQEEGITGTVRRVLRNVLKEEEELSRQRYPRGDINKSNYRFALLGKEMRDGRLCNRLKLIPRHKSRYLIAGDLWVDAKEFAIVSLEGKPSGSVSFWIGQPFTEQHFRSVNGFWMPSRNRSSAQVKLAGQTEFMVDYWDYKFQTAQDRGGLKRGLVSKSAPAP